MNHLLGIATRALGRELRLEPRLPAPFEDEVGGIAEVDTVVETSSVTDADVAPPAAPPAGGRPGPVDVAAERREIVVLREVGRSAPVGDGVIPNRAPAPAGRPASPARPETLRSRSSISQDPARGGIERIETLLAAVPPQARERLLRADPARPAAGPTQRPAGAPRSTADAATARRPAPGRRDVASPASGPGDPGRTPRTRPTDDSHDGRDGDQASAPVVEVTIGRVEVRAAPPSAPAARRPAAERRPALDLESYLRERARSS